MKDQEFEKLFWELSKCTRCSNFACKSKNLINFYQDYDFATHIPSVWTDWFHRLDSEIMIIGQDWGPYRDMVSLNRALLEDCSNWSTLIESEKSNTKKLLNYYICESSGQRYSLDNIFITNAIMCARQGDYYRGNNIDLKKSTMNCSEYLLRQIQILKPKVILTLGYYPLLSLSILFDFQIEKTLRDTIFYFPEIVLPEFVIIPLYHPVAQIRKSEQLKQYKRIWKYINCD